MFDKQSVTIEDIISISESHGPLGGKRSILDLGEYKISIVGGRQGLYGDFIDTFEVAIIDNNTHEFITRNFVSEANDDVLPYMSSEDVVNLINSILKVKIPS